MQTSNTVSSSTNPPSTNPPSTNPPSTNPPSTNPPLNGDDAKAIADAKAALVLKIQTEYPYGGNNGSVSGNTYCQGVWGSSDGKNKNMVCNKGYDKNTNKPVSCSTSFGVNNGDYAFDCSFADYVGNDGSVSGNTYCKGSWGNPTGKDKNMICLGGINQDTGEYVSCIQDLPNGHFGFDCALPNYFGNNGAVDGNTYCSGIWGSSKNKDLMCVGGISEDGTQLIDCSTFGTNKSWSYLCV